MTTKGCSLLADIATVYDATLDADANSVYLTVKNLRANPALKVFNEASAGSMATLNSGADVIAEKGSAGLAGLQAGSGFGFIGGVSGSAMLKYEF